MIIVIDGYNVLKEKLGASVSVHDRQSYVRQLVKYCAIRRHTCVLVFDGGDYGYASREIYGSVTVLYSGERSSADQVIMAYLEENYAKDILLITNDRAIIQYAERLKKHAISGRDFNKYVALALHEERVQKSTNRQMNVIAKTTSDADETIDALMEAYSNVIMHKSVDVAHAGEITDTRTKSKHERALLQILKKL